MTGETALVPAVVWVLGPLTITTTVVSTWIIMLLIAVLCWVATRRLEENPGPLQSALEAIVQAMEAAVAAVEPRHYRRILPFIASLWLFLVFANLAGLLPGADSPTGDLSATAALAILVFGATHWFGLRIRGPRAYLRHYLRPSPVLLPFHLISEVSRTVALAVRLFGNIMSLEMAALLILLVAGLLVPVPILMLHIVEALVQAYIFGMLALIFIAGGIQSTEPPEQVSPSDSDGESHRDRGEGDA